MKQGIAVVLAVGLTVGASSSYAAWQEGSEAARYSNVELVSVDPARRIVVVKDARGAREQLQMDDTLGSVGTVKPGDRVIITVRGGSGQRYLSGITRASGASSAVAIGAPAATAPLVVTQVPLSQTAPPATTNKMAAKEAFAAQVATISGDARPIDSMWSGFVTACNVKTSPAGDGRAWFGLWDNRVQADYSNGQCRDLFNQIVAAGEGTKKAMLGAEDVARKALTPGEIRDIRKVNLMDWDGWALPAPQKREP